MKIIVNYAPVHKITEANDGPNPHEATHYDLAEDGTLTVWNGTLLSGRYGFSEYTGFTAGNDFHPNGKYPGRKKS